MTGLPLLPLRLLESDAGYAAREIEARFPKTL